MAHAASRPLPGTHSPAAGFDQPFDMLAACHERVQRSLALLRRLVEHLAIAGVDGPARGAAQDVWRYFTLAAPQHHEDEERHVIPRLLASGDTTLVDAARTMRADHERMHTAWQQLGPVLDQLRSAADGPLPPGDLAALRTLATGFAALYDSHIPLEEGLTFPAARERADAGALAEMGAEMARRRGVAAPGG